MSAQISPHTHTHTDTVCVPQSKFPPSPHVSIIVPHCWGSCVKAIDYLYSARNATNAKPAKFSHFLSISWFYLYVFTFSFHFFLCLLATPATCRIQFVAETLHKKARLFNFFCSQFEILAPSWSLINYFYNLTFMSAFCVCRPWKEKDY